MSEAVIVEAVRTYISRGKPIVGDLHGFHAVDLLALSLDALVKRSGMIIVMWIMWPEGA